MERLKLATGTGNCHYKLLPCFSVKICYTSDSNFWLLVELFPAYLEAILLFFWQHQPAYGSNKIVITYVNCVFAFKMFSLICVPVLLILKTKTTT